MSGGPFVILGRGKSPDEPYQVGDVVDVYALDEALTVETHEVPPPAPSDVPPHDLARDAYRRVRAAARAARSGRKVREVRCTCPRRGLLAELVDVDGRRWALVSAERPPRSVRDRAPDGPTAWPLHNEPNGMPHVQPTSCDRCGTRWVLLLGADTVAARRVVRVTYDTTVKP